MDWPSRPAFRLTLAVTLVYFALRSVVVYLLPIPQAVHPVTPREPEPVADSKAWKSLDGLNVDQLLELAQLMNRQADLTLQRAKDQRPDPRRDAELASLQAKVEKLAPRSSGTDDASPPERAPRLDIDGLMRRYERMGDGMSRAEYRDVQERLDALMPYPDRAGWYRWADWVPASSRYGWTRWARRDLLITGLRLAALVACVVIAVRLGGLRRWGWHTGVVGNAAALLVLLEAGWSLANGTRTARIPLTQEELTPILLSTVVVALYEELAFRGLLFTSLSERMPARRAALVSAAYFTVWHLGIQSPWTFPFIFCWGVAACAALRLGVGLPWLALAHFFADSALYYLPADGPFQHYWLFLFAACVIAGSAFTLWWLVPEDDAEPTGAVRYREIRA